MPRGPDSGGKTAKDQADAYCFDLVRQGDKDRFLASLFAPDAVRRHLLALFAFNIELARIREAVSEPALGEFRLQWWRDAIDQIYAGEVPGHPGAQALARAIEIGSLPKPSLRNMIEARRFDLYDDPMPSLNDLEGYLGETSAALIQMSALVLDKEGARACAAASGLAGVAMGLTGLLRSLPIHRRRGQCFVPADMLARHGLTPANILSGRPEEPLDKVLAELRNAALARLVEARSKRSTITAEVYPAFLPVALTEPYLDRLNRVGAASLSRVSDISQARRQWLLYSCARRKVF